MTWHNGSAATCTCDQCEDRRAQPRPETFDEYMTRAFANAATAEGLVS